MNPPCRRCGGLGEVIESVYGHPTEKVKCHCVQELEEKVIENYDDDSVWETYVPEFGGMYSEGAWRSRDEELFKLTGWNHQGKGPVFLPNRETIIYRRRKTEAKPEPADDGPKWATRFSADVYEGMDHRFTVDKYEDSVSVRDCDDDVITIRLDEWPHVRAAIDRLIAECRE
jgi:hypothetical protein